MFRWLHLLVLHYSFWLIWTLSRSSFSQMFIKKDLLKIFEKLYRKTSMLGSLVNKVAGLQVIKKRLQYKHFSVKLAKFLRTPFYHGTHPVAASDFTLCFVY